jgi:hypothetical protein
MLNYKLVKQYNKSVTWLASGQIIISVSLLVGEWVSLLIT